MIERKDTLAEGRYADIRRMLDDICMKTNTDNVRIAVIPRPIGAAKSQAKYEGEGGGYPQLEIWKVSLDYGHLVYFTCELIANKNELFEAAVAFLDC